MAILLEGFEDVVRGKFGIDADDLPNEELNRPLVKGLAEAKIIKRVPTYASITELLDSLYIQEAVINQICASLCISMPKRLNLKVAISDVRIEKEKVDWAQWEQKFLSNVEDNLSSITSVDVLSLSTVEGAGGGIVSIIRNDKYPIGGEY